MSLDELREEIQAIDRELVELVAQRTYVAESVAAVKERQGLPTTDASQEQQVIDRARENADHFDLDEDIVSEVFELLIELNKVEQRNTR
ncbi:MAG: chorismate mutase [Halobacteriales archaeon]|nr:chorismate mutase [Halobacteriales archaeon]